MMIMLGFMNLYGFIYSNNIKIRPYYHYDSTLIDNIVYKWSNFVIFI
jgi:hypothetical protein